MKDESRSGRQPIFDVRVVTRRIERVNAQALTDHVAVMNRLYPEVGAAASVLPGFRNHGVQAALIRTRLMKARELGCDLAGIFALPGSISQRNAERHAFRLMYSKAILKAE